MSDTILDSVALAYQPVWDHDRRLAAVRVVVLAANPDAVDGAHLLQAIGEDWPGAAPLLSLSFCSPRMRNQALASEPLHNTLIEVPAEPFTTPVGLAPLALALRRGHQLLRQATLAEVRSEGAAPLAVRSLLRLSAEEALTALRARAGGPDRLACPPSPILSGQAYEGIGCRALAEHCLDDEGAWGLAGWPDDDVLHGWRERPLIGSASVIRACRQGIENDDSLDQLERFLRQDPVLVYRLLVWVNTASDGKAREIPTLRHAIMMLGLTALKHWLDEQLAGGEADENLHPVRYGQVMRARLAQHLLDPGCDEDLRAELYLAALLSQLDRLMQKPIGPLLHRLPLSERLLDAVLRKEGPYFALLDVAAAQGRFEHVHLLPAVCHAHEVTLEHANRSLLRMLATSRDQTQPPRVHPWAMDRN
jgi:EAL and modified HD-GYP domain-containing signal transduction protein